MSVPERPPIPRRPPIKASRGPADEVNLAAARPLHSEGEQGPSAAEASPPAIYTLGHSTRSLGEFLELLHFHGIRSLADIRTYPGSRRYPHFNREALAAALTEAGLTYLHIPELGGRRRPSPDSLHTGWRNEGFRGYAEHMQSAEFLGGLQRLVDHSGASVIAIMCSEAVPWRCHRNLVADSLVLLRGIPVRHIIDQSPPRPHTPTPFAQLREGKLLYPDPGDLFG